MRCRRRRRRDSGRSPANAEVADDGCVAPSISQSEAPCGQFYRRPDCFAVLRRIADIRLRRTGAFYSSLGLFRYIPQALAAGAVSILAINYFSYRRAAKRTSHDRAALRTNMLVTAGIGLAAMAGAFILLEWLNHAVIHGDRFLARPEFSEALIKGVPNVELLYVCGTFFALAVLWALPFPRGGVANTNSDGWMNRSVRAAVLAAAAVLIAAVVLDATPWTRTAASHQHGHGL